MVEQSMVRVLRRSAFHDTGLTSSGDLCYLGGEVIFSLSFSPLVFANVRMVFANVWHGCD